MKPVLTRTLRSLQSNILAGVITIGPLLVTYVIFSFLLGTLAKAGLPVVQLLAVLFPRAWFSQPWLQSAMAVVLTLVVLYVVGRLTSVVIGRQAFNLFEATLERLPFVAKVYTSVRQLLDSMMAKKESSQRVVLVDFPIARAEEHWLPHPHLHRFHQRRAAGRGAAAQRHQSDLGLFADSAHAEGHRDGHEHGAGHEHANDRRGRRPGYHPVHQTRNTVSCDGAAGR